jgi:hypothetical protein
MLFALYPQIELSRAEKTVTTTIGAAAAAAAPGTSTPVANR